MTEEAKILLEAAAMLRSSVPFAMVTITGASGSTPREIGARMIVKPDGATIGSIGGAAVERLAIETALESVRDGNTTSRHYNLNDVDGVQTGMVCGGRIELLIEPFGTSPRLHLFGAGHVGKAVAAIASDIGFNVTTYDSRPEWASAERFPQAQIITGELNDLADKFQPSASDFILLMTWCHRTDYEILTRIIKREYRYLGVIGSRKKALEIRRRLGEDGFDQADIDRITCPIGIPLPTHTPAEIAVAVAAQLLELRLRTER